MTFTFSIHEFSRSYRAGTDTVAAQASRKNGGQAAPSFVEGFPQRCRG